MTSVTLFPVSWQTRDVDSRDSSEFLITVYGKDPDGGLVVVHIEFFPYFFVRVPNQWGPGQVAYFVSQAAKDHGALAQYSRAVTKTSMWGFTNGEKIRVVQLAFPSLKKARWAAKSLKLAHTVFESKVDPLLRFFHIRDVQPASWIRVVNARQVDAPTTRAPTELRASFIHVGPADVQKVPKLVLASWDLEVYSESRRFPRSSEPSDAIIQVACTYQRFGEPEPYATRVFCLGDTDPVPGIEIHSYDEEHEVLHAFFDDLEAEAVDVMVGYNTNQFDSAYVLGRCEVLVDDEVANPMVDMARLGRDLEGGGQSKAWRLSSGAFGDNVFEQFSTPGVLQIDVLQILRRETKHDSYTLNNMAKVYLDDAKIDLPAHEIFDKYDGTSADRAVIAQYAAKDTVLPLRIMAKLCLLENLLEFANATFCPVDYIQNRGQQIRVFSVLMRKARALGMCCPDDVGIDAGNDKFSGATVLDAKKGAYFEPVVALDFASLYPSIIRAHKLDFSTIVLDSRYAKVPGIEYYRIATDRGEFTFAQTDDAVLPALLEDLARFRKDAKTKMAEAKARGDAFAASLYNAKQLAFKVTMNSAYGFCGAKNGMLSCVPIAASVTATGRAMIEKTKALAESLVPGSRVVYGDTDSVMVILGGLAASDMAAVFAKADYLASEISKTFPPPVELEFEKVYLPYLLYSKKRYAGLMYTKPDTPDYVDIKGLQLVRRDSPPLVKDVSTKILDRLMHDRSPDLAMREAKDAILKVLRDEEPLEKYVVSKTLRTDYKNPESQPHLIVARKIKARTGAHTQSGVRVPYVFVEDPANADLLLAQRAEDPGYVRDHGLVVDRVYYVHNQLASPIGALLEVLVEDPIKHVFGHPDISGMLKTLETRAAAHIKEAKRVRKNTTNRLQDITNFFKRVA